MGAKLPRSSYTVGLANLKTVYAADAVQTLMWATVDTATAEAVHDVRRFFLQKDPLNRNDNYTFRQYYDLPSFRSKITGAPLLRI